MLDVHHVIISEAIPVRPVLQLVSTLLTVHIFFQNVDPFQDEKASNQCHSCVRHRGAGKICWNSGSCRAHYLARIFVCIGDFNRCNRVAIRLGHASIQVGSIGLFVTSIR
jgi:hypothetical protein